MQTLLLVFRRGDAVEADVFDDEEGNCRDGGGCQEEENEFYPDSSQEEEEEVKEEVKEVTKPAPRAAPITEKVKTSLSSGRQVNQSSLFFLLPPGEQGDQHGRLTVGPSLLRGSAQRAAPGHPPAERLPEGQHHHPLQDLLPRTSKPVHLQGN